MKLFSPNRTDHRQSLRILTGILCVLLILFVGAAQTLHMHAPDEAANPGCSLCAVAHVTALPAPVLVTPVVAEMVAAVAYAPQTAAVPNQFFSFGLYVRPPPPASTTLS
jgi:hypothetical protein